MSVIVINDFASLSFASYALCAIYTCIYIGQYAPARCLSTTIHYIRKEVTAISRQLRREINYVWSGGRWKKEDSLSLSCARSLSWESLSVFIAPIAFLSLISFAWECVKNVRTREIVWEHVRLWWGYLISGDNNKQQQSCVAGKIIRKEKQQFH